ncbi:hypothetical protein ACIP8I_07290 [Pseudomonas sp. NPDC088414]|uniref:hypothetical protein n=1 Tax=Pseudomonas sp. NPDC088414 TaxID=3364454 RepID=UPI00381DC977
MNIPSISNNILELYPVLIPGWITPIKPADRADGGIPKSIYDGNPLGLQVVIDPWTERRFFQDPKAEFDSVALYLNDDEPPVASHTVQPGDEHKRIPLYVPHNLLKHGTNRLYYVVTRLGGHPQPSRDLDVLYHLQGPIDLVLEIPGDVVTDGISAERAAQGVKFTFKYTGPELYDLVRLQIGNHAFDLEVTHPGAELSMTLYTADFEKTGDGKLTVYFRVTDQLGNFEISDSTTLDIHLAVELTAPTITSVQDESKWEIPDNGHTVHTRITLTGSAPPGQKVEVFLGAISKGIAEAGSDRIWTRTVSGLALNVLHTLKAVGQYANNPTSNLWRLTVLNGVAPTITAAHDSNGQPISNGGSTPDPRIRLTGTANTFLEVEIYDGAISTGKKARADDKGVWTVLLTWLTPTRHEFKAKALYGSGTESGVWAVTVTDLVDLVEDFQSYPRATHLKIPGDSVSGTNTKVTLNESFGGVENYQHMVAVVSELNGYSYTSTAPNILAYSLELKQGNARSALIRAELYDGYGSPFYVMLEFRQNNDVVDSILLHEGPGGISIDEEFTPRNGQAFDTLKFEIKGKSSNHAAVAFRIAKITFKS